jgi:hypothetical protein
MNRQEGPGFHIASCIKTACLERKQDNSWSATDEARHKPQGKMCYVAIIHFVG